MFAIQLVALIVLFFITYFYWHIFRVNLQNIEVQGFNEAVYSAPTQGYAWRALGVCAWTVFVGIKIHKKLELVSVLMLGLGGVFFLLALLMLFQPRVATIADVRYYWYFFNTAMLGLTALAFIFYDQNAQPIAETDYDDVLDHLSDNSADPS